MSKLSELGNSLYTGRVSVDFVGRRMTWYAISAVIVVVSLLGLTLKQLNLGIEFEGGTEYEAPVAAGTASQETLDGVRQAILDTAEAEGIEEASTLTINASGEDRNRIRIQTGVLENAQSDAIGAAISKDLGIEQDEISVQAIGASWGEQIADRALLGLIVFLILVVVLIALYTRQWKMSVAALAALAHDLVITVGIYALSGFEVTPATVTGFLTILGFSLYDTVVVFDKIRENTMAMAKTGQTYREAANLAVNQTLVRSINTSIVALIPVGALLYVGVAFLGSGPLKDLALALFVGMAAGVYSSVFIAPALFVQLKELEPGVKAGDTRAMRDRSRGIDPYAAVVPEFREDMEIMDEGVDVSEAELPPSNQAEPQGNRAVAPEHTDKFTGARGGTARPISDTSAAARPQPQRKPRSKRGK